MSRRHRYETRTVVPVAEYVPEPEYVDAGEAEPLECEETVVVQGTNSGKTEHIFRNMAYPSWLQRRL